MPTVVIICSAMSYRVARLVDAATSLHIDTVIATSDASVADRVPIDLSNARGSADAIADLRRHVDAVIAVDVAGLMIAALAADRLGIPHNPPTAVAALANKAMMRRALRRAGVRQPAFELATVSDDTVALAEYLGAHVLLKPLSLSRSTGIIEIDHPLAALQAEERIRRILALHNRNPNEPILVERHIEGPEVRLDGFLVSGNLEAVALFDEPAGSQHEEIRVTPSRLHPEIVEEVVAVAALAVTALGLSEGPVQVESRIQSGHVVVIQVNASPTGGSFPPCSSSDTGELLLRRILHMPIPDKPEPTAFGVLQVRTHRAGTFQGVAGKDLVLGLPAITRLTVDVPPGTYVIPLPGASPHLMSLCASGSSPEEVQRSLQTARSLLRLDIV